MASVTASRPGSTSSNRSTGSLMQDVPGAYPPPVHILGGVADEHGEGDHFQSLSQAVHARRAEYVRPKQLRIKIGTWNVASHKGTEKDLGGWFVQGKGVTEALAGLDINEGDDLRRGESGSDQADMDEREDVAAQEERYKRKHNTLPKGDPGSLPGDGDVALYVLGLQEVVDINSASEALRPYTDPAVAAKWKEAMQKSLPHAYQCVAEQQLLGLLLLVFASPDVAKEVRSVSTTSVGTGLMGYMGNKGAVTARIILGETTRLVFINSHLAAGADKASLERRNWDTAQIVARTRFEPIKDTMDLSQTAGEQIGDEDFAFWVGDLNYRLKDIPGDDVRRLLMLHTRNEYDLSQRSAQKVEDELADATDAVKHRVQDRQQLQSVSSDSLHLADEEASNEARSETTLVDDILDASLDPASLQTTLSSLLPHDELHQQMKERKAFHDGWREGPIAFIPTYKYDVGSVGVFDSSEKKRAPSWCDRILYRTRRDKLAFEAQVQEEENARKKDEDMRIDGTAEAAEDEDVLYDYDPDADGATPTGATIGAYDYDDHDEHEEVPDDVVVTREGFEDEIKLEYYTTHQRVLSSDHKPLNAIFILKYEAVVPDLKLKVHAEVAREMDKRENEGRPSVTVVVDKNNLGDTERDDDDPATFEGVVLGDVRWAAGKHRSLTIANTGRVPATASFIERPIGAGQASGIAPKWLNLKVYDASVASSDSCSTPIHLEPGDSCTVELSVRILDIETVRALNGGIKDLDDILVLRVEGGRDHFIPVRGRWQDSSLGRSIDKLCRIPEGGIRKLQNQRPHGHGRTKASSNASSTTSSNGATMTRQSLDEQPVRFSAPRELFRLTEAIEELSARIVAEWEMINTSVTPTGVAIDADEVSITPWQQFQAWPFDQNAWTDRDTDEWFDMLSSACNALDCDEPLDASFPAEIPRIQKLYVMCNLTTIFLSALPDGIIPEASWRTIDSHMAEQEKARRKLSAEEERTAVQELLLQSSPSHSISFVLITTFLDRLLNEIITTVSRDQEVSLALMPTSPGKRPGIGTLRRMTGLGKALPPPSSNATSPTKKLPEAQKAMADVFATMIVRMYGNGSEKGKAAQQRRMASMVKVFLGKEDS